MNHDEIELLPGADEPEPDNEGSDSPKPAEGKGKDDDPIREMREELKTLRNRVSEAEQNTKYWYEQANGRSAKPAVEAEEEPDEEVKLDEDLVDVISSGDTRKIRDTFKKLGFVSEKEVAQRITQTKAQIAEEAKLYGRFPELQEPESEFFQATAKEYNRMAKSDPGFAKSPKAIEFAAEMAAARLGLDESPKPRKAQRVENEDDDDYEAERVSRVSSQQGDRGRRAAKSTRDDGDLSTGQQSIIARFQAAGSALTVDGYRKRAQAGVKMSGFGKRR